jgi:hypothetical protein
MEVSINKKEKRDEEIDNYYNLIESEYMEDIEVINKYLEQETFFKKEIRKQKKADKDQNNRSRISKNPNSPNNPNKIKQTKKIIKSSTDSVFITKYYLEENR